MFNPPSLWLTINPCDLHDPIAQVFAGEHIDLDNFNAQLGPSKERRAQNVAADPYASAKFLHYLIKVILETLFGISYPLWHNAPSEGVFGRLTAYFGVVESQGRGTLHLHVLLWLANAPPMEEMERQLKKPEFRNHVRNFIEANIHAYVPGLETEESLRAIPNDTEGKISTKNQVTDYSLRGDLLVDANIIDFFVGSYEMNVDHKESSLSSKYDGDGKWRGRPRHDRIPYLALHPNSSCKQRVKRAAGHNNLPNFIGQCFPRRDVTDNYSFYCACMLMLLKPWRSLATDLKRPLQSWESAFDEFLASAEQQIHNIISGIQYFHECKSSALQQNRDFDVVDENLHAHEPLMQDLQQDNSQDPSVHMLLSEESLVNLMSSQTCDREDIHGRLAIESGKMAGIFDEVNDQLSDTQQFSTCGVKVATDNDVCNLVAWKQQMSNDISRQKVAADSPHDINEKA
ncbi:hypothetical protein PISMIDRAFT_9649 [Pisolithus microcarpus 441]|uniref:Helitron helicase-like domain-containing protein n=1 Tax=Pisolithus microcarpus 441 TaxID=765257 RepID=A0A0C9YJY4_9AGAM|nr:hypothetical protein PISMIDRAFT_9649 [Pisolithus microcarpus 441]